MAQSESTSPKVIVAMPAFNEERYVGSLVLLASRYADEVIVVDDGSTDRTSSVAKFAGATVIRHDENRGSGAALQTIMAAARKRNPDVLVVMDADAQHDPKDIPTLVKAVSQGFDLVIGSRKMTDNRIPAYRRVGQGVLSFFTNLLSEEKLTDTESGFRAFSRKALAEVQLTEQGMAACAEVISVASARGLKITEVPISVVYTKDGSTLNPIRHGVTVLGRIMHMISERRPLLFFGSLGGASMVFGVVEGVLVFQVQRASQVLQVGSALVAMLLITVGVLLISTGLILSVLVHRIGRS